MSSAYTIAPMTVQNSKCHANPQPHESQALSVVCRTGLQGWLRARLWSWVDSEPIRSHRSRASLGQGDGGGQKRTIGPEPRKVKSPEDAGGGNQWGRIGPAPKICIAVPCESAGPFDGALNELLDWGGPKVRSNGRIMGQNETTRGPLVLVHVSTCQGKPFGVPSFDPQPFVHIRWRDLQPGFMGIGFKAVYKRYARVVVHDQRRPRAEETARDGTPPGWLQRIPFRIISHHLRTLE